MLPLYKNQILLSTVLPVIHVFFIMTTSKWSFYTGLTVIISHYHLKQNWKMLPRKVSQYLSKWAGNSLLTSLKLQYLKSFTGGWANVQGVLKGRSNMKGGVRTLYALSPKLAKTITYYYSVIEWEYSFLSLNSWLKDLCKIYKGEELTIDTVSREILIPSDSAMLPNSTLENGNFDQAKYQCWVQFQ